MIQLDSGNANHFLPSILFHRLASILISSFIVRWSNGTCLAVYAEFHSSYTSLGWWLNVFVCVRALISTKRCDFICADSCIDLWFCISTDHLHIARLRLYAVWCTLCSIWINGIPVSVVGIYSMHQCVIIDMRKMWLNHTAKAFRLHSEFVCTSAIVTFVFARSMPYGNVKELKTNEIKKNGIRTGHSKKIKWKKW